MDKTFQFQDKVDKLPLPEVEETCEKYLEWVKPLISNEEFKVTEKVTKDFVENEGSILQKRLVKWNEDNEGNWLYPIWDSMYKEMRYPISINVNYILKLFTEDIKEKCKSTEIAAVMIRKLIEVYFEIVNEEYEPEMIKGKPLCMSQYKNMFKGTRIPKLNRDEFLVEPVTLKNHIIIMYKNNMYKMPVTDDEGRVVSYNAIVNTLNKLISSKSIKSGQGIGVITTGERDKAALILEEVLKKDKNIESFETLKNALFLVCIDEKHNSTKEFVKALLCSNGENRYFDKCFQLIFDENGDFGLNFEHTGADGATWINILERAKKDVNNIDTYRVSSLKDDKVELNKLEWELSEEILKDIEEIKKGHNESEDNIEIELIDFQKFGKKKIKNLGYAPDGFFHAAIQLAQYRVFKKFRSTYESVATRKFLYGRTECNRAVTCEVLDFVKAFDSKKVELDDLKQLMEKAFKKHSSRAKQCQEGKGIHRHMLGLVTMYNLFGQELGIKETPKWFKDQSYKKLSHDFLSTSRLESECFEYFGFGPVVDDGFGLGYFMLDNCIKICLTTKKDINGTIIKKFADQIIQAFLDLAEI